MTPALFVMVLLTDDGRLALDEYARAAYGLPLSVVETIQLLVAGPPGYVREVLDRYVGVEHLVVRIGALDLDTQREQLGRLARPYQEPAP